MNKTVLLRSDKPLDTARSAHAANLYNSVYTSLIEDGWTEERKDPSPFWPDGEPTGNWRHPSPERVGTYSMDAAYGAYILARPRRT